MGKKAGFGARLEQWRKAANMTQRDLDAALRKGARSSFTAQVEIGTINPPDRETCWAIADVLGVGRDEVWDAAAAERLRALHPDLADWYAADPERLTDPERDLVEAIRDTRGRGGAGLARALASWVRAVESSRDPAGRGTVDPDPIDFLAAALTDLAGLGPDVQRAMVDHLYVSTTDLEEAIGDMTEPRFVELAIRSVLGRPATPPHSPAAPDARRYALTAISEIDAEAAAAWTGPRQGKVVVTEADPDDPAIVRAGRKPR